VGTLYIVATPIGNLGDITARAIETMQNVDLIAVEDTRVTIKLLNYFNIKTKMISYHNFNEEKRTNEIITHLEQGRDIALVSDAGTPCISDPGFLLVKKSKEKGINVIGIPGPSAIINALAISGLPSTNFTFYGFLAKENSKFNKQIKEIKESIIPTFIFYESPRRIVKLIDKLMSEFPNSFVSIASDMTKKFERNFFGPIEEVYEVIKNDEKIEKGEYVIILSKEKNKENKKEESFSLEALLIDTMIKENISIKDAIDFLSKQNKSLSKNKLYDASLNLKDLFKR